METRNVLLVEDDPFWEKIVAHSMMQMKSNVNLVCVKTAEKAIDLVCSNASYDIIISDHYLEGKKTGLDLWKDCKAEHAYIPFILTSGVSQNELSGINKITTSLPYYLPKPFSMKDLHQLVQTELTTVGFEKSSLDLQSSINKKDAFLVGAIGMALVLAMTQLPKVPTQKEIHSILKSNSVSKNASSEVKMKKDFLKQLKK